MKFYLIFKMEGGEYKNKKKYIFFTPPQCFGISDPSLLFSALKPSVHFLSVYFFFGIYSFHSGGLGRLYLPIFGGGNAIPFDISKKKKKEKIIHVYHK